MIGFKDRVMADKSISKAGDSEPSNSEVPLSMQEISRCTLDIISLRKVLTEIIIM